MATGFNTQIGGGEYRLQFETNNKEYYLLMQTTARRCVDGKPTTNADRIRSMSDEELSILLCSGTACEQIPQKVCETFTRCTECTLAWLKQPAKENDP